MLAAVVVCAVGVLNHPLLSAAVVLFAVLLFF